MSWYLCPKHTNSQQVGVDDSYRTETEELRIFPNPFDSEISIQINVQETAQSELAIYNLMGEKISVIFDAVAQTGMQTFKFDAKDLPPGLYICSLNLAGRVIKKNIMRIAK
jgi:hypothetical protein